MREVHERLNAMTPAESLAGFDARITELSRKMDSVSAGSPDPETLRYLEAAIKELRELSAGVASAEGVASLAGDVQALGTRIDHIAERTGATGLDSLAHRVTELTQALDTRVEQIGPLPQNIEALVQALSDKLNHSDSATRDQAAFEHIERQILHIADKLDAADHKSGDLRAIERGIQQLTLQVREAREEAIATAERVARKVAADMADAVTAPGADVSVLKRDLESLHVTHVESEQRTHETLEAVHDTLERLVERLATIETGAPTAPPAYMPPHQPEPPRHRRMSRRSMRRRCSPSNRRRCLRRARWSPLHRASPRPPCRHARLRSCMCSAPSARRSIRTFRPIRRSNPAAPGVRAHRPSASPPRKPHSPRSSASRPRKLPAKRISLRPRGAPHRPRRVKAARSKVRAAKNARARRHRPA